MYDEDELEEIQNEFKRKELMTHALGPSVSLIIHIVLFLVLFFLVRAQFQEEETTVEVTMVKEVTDEVIETPEDIDDITETEMESSDTSESEAPAEDAPDEINTDISEDTLDVPDTDLLSFTVETASPYKTRTIQGKAVQVARGGGDKRALSTVLSALKWLKVNQNPDGSWGESHKGNIVESKAAITGLATLLYLAHGETPGSKHFGKTVQKSLKWLNRYIRSDAALGQGRPAKYGLAIVTYSLAEGYSLTSIKDLEEGMNIGVQKMFKNINPNGWVDYHPQTDDQDLSITGWYFQAVKAAYLAGCTDPQMIKYIKKIPNMVLSNGFDVYGRSNEKNTFKYRTAARHKHFWYGENGSGSNKDHVQSSSGMRALGALCLQLFGEKQKAMPAARLIAREDIKRLNFKVEQGYPMYSWYYATQVMYNNKDTRSGDWDRWNRTFQKMLYESQFKEGYWDTPGTRPEIGSNLGAGVSRKVYATSLAGLMLTVYYRYLPTTKLSPPKKAKKVTADTQEVELDFL